MPESHRYPPTAARAARIAAVGLLAFGLAAVGATAVTVPPGFSVTKVAGDGDLSFVTSLAFDGDGVLHFAEANIFTNTGRVRRLEDADRDGTPETILPYADGFGVVTGVTFRGIGFPLPPADCRAARSSRSATSAATDLERIRRGAFAGRSLDLYVSHFVPGIGGGGQISAVRDLDHDGIADDRTDVITALPSDGENGNQQIAVGNDGRIYFGQGARTNSGVPGGGPPDGPLSGTVLRAAGDGSGLEVHARGLRNVFDLVFTPCGELIATENGPDPTGPNPIADAPDELNQIVAGGDYGWPNHFGFPPADTGTIGPIVPFATGTSSDGLALVTPAGFCGYEGDLIVAQFGSFVDPTIGRRLVRVRNVGTRAVLVETFATGFDRPLDVAFGPDGALYVADFSSVFFSPNSASIYRIAPTDSDGDGTPDICAP